MTKPKILATQSESKTVTAICSYLRWKRHFFWRQNNVGIWDQKRHAYRVNQNTLKGIPDIFVMKSNGFGGNLYGIEVKSQTGRQSPEQREFQALFEANGGIYILVRSVEDVVREGL